MPIYLDNNATTPLAPEVRATMLRYFDEEYGNAGSRTHEFGLRASQAVQQARASVAKVVGADPSEVVFTSGATEGNNLAILGLAAFAERTGRRHIVSTTIEHKAVLEPLEALQARGFDVTLVPVGASGRVSAAQVAEAVRPETVLVSVMQANNETGVLQPITEIAEALAGTDTYLHVDAAQGFGKELQSLRNPRVDLISASGHKLFAPKGVGALIARRRGPQRPPLEPLMYGGGQERGLRPGTLPVPLIAGFGTACELALSEHDERARRCFGMKLEVWPHLVEAGAQVIGDPDHALPHVLSVAFPGVDSEALMLALKDLAALSNGSACTSSSYKPSHVLTAMGLPDEIVAGAVRISWSHLSEPPPWSELASRIAGLRAFA